VCSPGSAIVSSYPMEIIVHFAGSAGSPLQADLVVVILEVVIMVAMIMVAVMLVVLISVVVMLVLSVTLAVGAKP
jgi:hypothetical protein